MFKPTFLLLALTAATAQADVAVSFQEGAPKDRFTLTNTGDCALPALRATLDIGAAPAGLIFDTTSRGAGVQVFQPFELVKGASLLRKTPVVGDGDTAIDFDLKGMAPNASLAFTIDVDDTGGGREITVSGSEMQGAAVSITIGTKVHSARFDDTARAVITTPDCLS